MSRAARCSSFAFALALCCPRWAAAGVESSDVPTFSYRDRTLAVGVVSYAAEPGEIVWRALPATGRLGPERRRKVELQVGLNAFELPVGADSAHSVSIRTSGGRSFELLANRGTWFALPRELRIDQTQKELGLDSKLTAGRDVVLGRGFSAIATQGDGTSPLEVGRTFTRGAEGGVPLAGFSAVVLVAGGSVGAIRVTLTEKRGKTDVYWDTEVDLGSDFKRLVIPLSSLVPREPKTRGRPKSAYSLSLRASVPSLRGAGIEIDLLGFLRTVPRVEHPVRRGEMVRFPAPPRSPFSPIELHLAEEGGARRVEMLESEAFELRSLGQLSYWFCYEERVGAKVCDPADAPATHYAIAPMPGGRLLVDDFDGRVAVNHFREPLELFASDPFLGARPRSLRKDGQVLLRLDEAQPGAYIGLKIPLPDLDPNIRTLELVFGGVEGADRIDVGLNTSSGAEPKLRLADYLAGPRSGVARIPFEAFAAMQRSSRRARKLGRPRAVTLALSPGSSFSLDRVAMSWEVAPVVVARFDGTGAPKTALGGRVAARGTGGIRVRSSTVSIDGDPALRVEMLRSTAQSSAVVALGFGALDTRAHETLSFALTDESKSRAGQVYLTSGKTLARLPLARYAKGGARLERVAIPLRDFGARIARDRINQISLTFDADVLENGFIELDDVRFD